MSEQQVCKLMKVFERCSTADEVYAAAEAACNRCGEGYRRCSGYNVCRMFAALDAKLDAIEALHEVP